MIEKFKLIWNPELYHGEFKRSNFFEGWYFKNIGEDKSSVLSIIPGVFRSPDKSKEHAFIQFIDGITRETHYIKFPYESFKNNKEKFEISIEKNFFSENNISLNIERSGFKAFGELNFKGITPWGKKFLSPGVMGWYSFVPFMECNHGIISLNHNVRGKVLINKNIYLYTFGKGYIEKDWGKSFPSSYIWMQSNNFYNKEVSFFCSIARIPWFGKHFRGYIAGLYLDGKLYKFTTYTGAKLDNLCVTENHVDFVLHDKIYNLRVVANRNTGGLLHAPYDNNMSEGRVHETLLSKIEIILEYKKGGMTIFEGTGEFAGLEITGNLSEIL